VSAESRRVRLFGTEFPDKPMARGQKAGADWRSWIDARLTEQQATAQDMRLHYSRHRHFRLGRQWISSRDGRTWRELDHDKNKVRAVLNVIGPALDFRLGLLDEQRPDRRDCLPSCVCAEGDGWGECAAGR